MHKLSTSCRPGRTGEELGQVRPEPDEEAPDWLVNAGSRSEMMPVGIVRRSGETGVYITIRRKYML